MCFVLVAYGRFRRTSIITSPITTIAMIIATVAGRMYRSAIDSGGACVGATVGAALPTAR